MGRGPLMAVDSYRKYAFSCLSHVQQLCPPPPRACFQELHLQASLMSMPVHAIPHGLLINRAHLGIGLAMPSSWPASMAARCRVYCNSNVVQGIEARLQDLLHSNEVALQGLSASVVQGVLAGSYIQKLRDAYDFVYGINDSLLEPGRGQQRKVLSALIAHLHAEPSLAVDVQKRLLKIGLQVSVYNIVHASRIPTSPSPASSSQQPAARSQQPAASSQKLAPR